MYYALIFQTNHISKADLNDLKFTFIICLIPSIWSSEGSSKLKHTSIKPWGEIHDQIKILNLLHTCLDLVVKKPEQITKHVPLRLIF